MSQRCDHCGQIIPREMSPEEQERFDCKYLHPDTFRELKLVEQQTYSMPGARYSHSDWRVVIVNGYGNIRCYLTGDCRDKEEGERMLAEMQQNEASWLAKEEKTRDFQLSHSTDPNSELRQYGYKR